MESFKVAEIKLGRAENNGPLRLIEGFYLLIYWKGYISFSQTLMPQIFVDL